jgi:hypothetical protein
MAQEYQPRRFFRNAPNRLLRRYFAARNVLSAVDFGALTETQVEPIYGAWLKLSDDVRKEMEQDFQDIDELATEGGSKAILDEARWHGEDLAERFASLTGFHEHALWTFLLRRVLESHRVRLLKAKNAQPSSEPRTNGVISNFTYSFL